MLSSCYNSAFRGMLTLHSHRPVLTESLHIPMLCLSGKSYPTQSSVELSNDAQGQTSTRLSVWPAFHNGVAAGLCLDQRAVIDTAWILYNKVGAWHYWTAVDVTVWWGTGAAEVSTDPEHCYITSSVTETALLAKYNFNTPCSCIQLHFILIL